MRKFVLVTATQTKIGETALSSAGIRKLKRGTELAEFITEYLRPMGSIAELLDRGTTVTAISRTPNEVLTWCFTVFEETELLGAAKHLTREELLRDLKELLPLRGFS